MFSLASVPGAIIGASVTTFLSRGIFQILFGLALLLAAIYLLVSPERNRGTRSVVPVGNTSRQIIDEQNNVFRYSFSLPKGIAIAFGVGLISGLLGIGGGIVHVPALTQLVGFPAHIATATSHFVVAVTTFAAVNVHIVSGVFTEGVRRAVALSVGAIIGAQFGARLSQKVPGVLILRLLAGGLGLVGIRLLIALF